MNNKVIANIENATGITYMKRVDWFKADRSLSQHVVDFMRCFVWRKDIELRFKADAEDIDKGIASLEKLQGSILADKIPEMRQVYLARKAELEQQKREQIRKEATYALSEADKELKKSLTKYARDNSADPVAAICKWFGQHGMPIKEDNPILDEIFRATGEKIDLRTVVGTSGRVVTNFNSGNCFKMVFAKCYEHMCQVGTIKEVQIPKAVAEKYAPKQKKSKKAVAA